MKLAKSHKIILIITAVALSVMLALCSFNLFVSKAEGAEPVTPTASSYFTADNCVIDDSGAKFTVENGKTVSINNELCIGAMKIKLGTVENIKTLELVLTYDSYYVNGNKKVVTEGGNKITTFEKEIVNKFELTPSSNDEIAIGMTASSEVTVNGSAKAVANFNDERTDNDFDYGIRNEYCVTAKISFKATLTDGATSGSFIITDIDQNVNDAEGKYNQSLKTVDGKLTPANPVIAFDADMFVRDTGDSNYHPVAYAGEVYSLSYKVYSVLGNVSASDINPKANTAYADDVTIPTDNKNETQDKIYFKSSAKNREIGFDLVNKADNTVYITHMVEVKEKLDKTASDTENSAPKYFEDALAIEAFRAELEKQYYALDEDGNFKLDEDGNRIFVPLGTEIEIPSLEDLVFDDRTPYDKLTKTVYYASGEEKNTTSLKFTLDVVGDYYFFVAFTDSEGKGMKKDDFYKEEDDGTITFGQYEEFIFYFNIAEDTEIVINAPTKQGVGYKGTKYTAAKFDITSSNCHITYTLEYTDKEEPTEEDWVEIPKFSTDLGEDYNENGYDYETLEKINYDGEYTFTPDKEGKYRITVNVSSKISFMSNSASTVIEVKEEAKVVTANTSSWIKDNVWSVVFLSVGTLCLAGILVLLFIKPKEKKVDEEE